LVAGAHFALTNDGEVETGAAAGEKVPALISCQVFTLAGCGANGTRRKRKVKTRIYEAGAGVK